MDELRRLSELIQVRNGIAGQISALIGRPALIGHVGEFIAEIYPTQSNKLLVLSAE